MAKFNTLPPARPKGGTAEEAVATRQRNNLFNLKSFNELKKDQTNIKIFKNSSFDSNFNALARLQNLDTNLSNSSLLLKSTTISSLPAPAFRQGGGGSRYATKNIKAASLSLQRAISGVLRTKREGSYPKISAILRAIRSIRLNRDEWKLIKYINLSIAQSLPLAPGGRERKGKKLRSNPLFGCPTLPQITAKRQGILSPPVAPQNKKKGALARGPAGGAVLRKVGGIIDPSSTIAPSSNNISCPSPSAYKKQVLLPYGSRHNSLLIKQKSYNKIYTYNNIISKNILLRNMKYNFLNSTLSSILKKKIRRISELLEEKPIKNYVLYSYLKNCIFTPPHIASLSDSKVTAPSPSEGLAYGEAGRGVPAPMSGREAVPLPLAGRSKLSLNKYKGRKFGSFINYNKIIGFKFNSTFYQAFPASLPAKDSPLASGGGGRQSYGVSFARAVQSPPFPSQGLSCNRYIKDTYKLLFYLFKSMYCLISKPVLKYTNDKVTIQLFYYLNIPKKKIFRLFSISYIKSIKKKWLAQSTTAHSSLISKGECFAYSGRGNTKLNIRWKIRKAISRLKNKIITSAAGTPSRGSDSFPSRTVATTLPYGRGGGSSNQILRESSPSATSPRQRRVLRRQGGWEAGKKILFLLRKFNLSKVYQKKFKLICAILSKKFNKPVELQLIRLHHPYHDSNILVNLLSLNIKNKRKKARVAIQKIYNKKPVKNLNDPNLKTSSPARPEGQGGKVPLIPAFLSGLNIKIAGRLMGEPIIPRITTKVYGKGASATGKVNYLDVARITKKNRKGAYTIKITSGQNFF